ncbi:exopolyphosphatase [Faucicola boevrei]|uniref:exopolyphosphatase n=1 Tax=Faucicola boevrei TaxID=346665 RepID=UPI00036C3DA8|nr:exopolyphosphatase [Moraxella boevrei]
MPTLVNNLSHSELMAAIDLGSNSFHLAIARLDHHEVRKLASMSEKVQLANGLDENNVLSEEAIERGVACLSRFVGRLDAVSPERLRVVATNTLRQAKNADEFIRRANAVLPKPIEIIAGREEARLIYLGVSHTNASTDKRLVIDIGGGSTEFIIGKGFDPILTESLQMGCVSFSKRFFVNGEINEKNFEKAIAQARKELLVISRQYQKTGWDSVTGSSGTIKAVKQILVNLGMDDNDQITFKGVKYLQKQLIKIKHIDNIDFAEIKDTRKAVLPAGVAVLLASMSVLGIDTMAYSDGALREGVMYDMLGRFASEDVRDRSVQALMNRYSVDAKQAKRVVKTAKQLFDQVQDTLGLDEEDADLLRRGAYLHEIGLAVSHSGYHRHSAYLLANSDIDGFSQTDKSRLAQMVMHHRRKLKSEGYQLISQAGGEKLVYLTLLLRLAVLIHHSRSKQEILPLTLTLSDKNHWQIGINPKLSQDFDQTLDNSQLLLSDLQEESQLWQKWGMSLDIQSQPHS